MRKVCPQPEHFATKNVSKEAIKQGVASTGVSIRHSKANRSHSHNCISRARLATALPGNLLFQVVAPFALCRPGVCTWAELLSLLL